MITERNYPISCVVDARATLAPGVVLGQGVIITGEVALAEGVQVGHHCVLEGQPHRPTVIGANTVIEDFVRVYPGVHLERDSRLGTFSILGHPTKAILEGRDNAVHSQRVQDLLVPRPETVIGPGALIRSHSVIYSHVQIGAHLITGHHIMIREHTNIGDHCVFGTHASTDGYCRLGRWAHIGQYGQLSQSARIGDGVFIGGHTVFSDNKQAIRSIEDDLFGATIGSYVRVGLGCVILPSVRIGDSSMVGAGSVVTRDIPARTLAYGNPARVARELTDDEVSRYVTPIQNRD